MYVHITSISGLNMLISSISAHFVMLHHPKIEIKSHPYVTFEKSQGVTNSKQWCKAELTCVETASTVSGCKKHSDN